MGRRKVGTPAVYEGYSGQQKLIQAEREIGTGLFSSCPRDFSGICLFYTTDIDEYALKQ